MSPGRRLRPVGRGARRAGGAARPRGARRRARPRRRRARGARAQRGDRDRRQPVETLVAVKNALDGAPVYVHLDLDVLDPERLPGPVPGARRPAARTSSTTCSRPWPTDCELVGLEVTAFEAPEDELRAPGGRVGGAARARAAAGRDPGGAPMSATEHRRQGPRPRPRPTRWSRGPRCARWSRTCTSAARRRGWAAAQEKIERQHAQDKLTARERLALLIDEGTFTELGIHGRPHFSQRAMEDKEAPADGVITGYGKVDGRLVAVCAYDFTVMAGSMGMTGELKVTRLRDLALGKRIPLHLAARLRRRAHPGGRRLAVRRLGPPVPRGGHDERRDPAGGRADGALRGGHRLHPRASPTSCRWSRAAARWRWPARTSRKAVTGEDVTQEELGGSKRPHQDLRRRRPRGQVRRGVHPGDQGLPVLLPAELRGAAAAARALGPGRPRWTRSCSTCCPTRRASPTTCTT